MVKEHLNDGGVMVVNMNMKTGRKGGINDYLIDTICSVFPKVATVDVGNNTNQELLPEKTVIFSIHFNRKLPLFRQRMSLKSQMEEVSENLEEREGGISS